ncbi:helix-turn-helix domain-containing protein [Desertibacillus haloalkaliphilus]|uniref:helix-turn-helix domain-containing protein n=1 Tax=Desertibacillus haloalkaliphilus TaxID=1328930 RepID=UPI001C258930|nr:helix-turn-helix domain-containing protein [Desertibacillus haloalkaliphilus]MBU8908073.1 helix-turn-helix domain-containing protein [Desertibacillus haloalkaliphilus]
MANIDVSLLEDKFKEDPLFIEIKSRADIDDELFPESIKNMYPDREYSTKEARGILNKPDSTVRYYINELKDYIQPLRNGRNFRLTVTHIFRLHLVFILIAAGKTVHDLRVNLGLDIQRVEGDQNNRINGNPIKNQKQLIALMQELSRQNQLLMNQSIEYRQLIHNSNLKRDSIIKHTIEIQKKMIEKEKLQNELSEYRQQKRRDLIDQNLIKLLTKSKQPQKKIFGIFPVKNDNDGDIDNEKMLINNLEKDDKEKSLESNIKTLEDDIEKSNKDIIALEESISALNRQLESKDQILESFISYKEIASTTDGTNK